MPAMSGTLEIRIHLCDGAVRSFRQDDPARQRAVLSRLDPQRVFDEPVLVIGDSGQLGTIRTAAVLRIEVRGPIPEEWSFGHGFDSITVVAEQDFLADRTASESDRSPRTGDPYVVHAEVRDVCGGKTFLRVEGRVMPDAVRTNRLERMMQRPCMLARRDDREVVLMQLANVACFTVRPSVQLPAKALDLTEVRPS
jgi:hypothetical protein